MAPAGDKAKWDRVYKIWAGIASIEERRPVQSAYATYHKDNMTAEDAMEKALIEHGYLPPISAMKVGADEYEDIMAGEEIWEIIQRNSGN